MMEDPLAPGSFPKSTEAPDSIARDSAVTVLVVTRDRRDELRRLLNSVFMQSVVGEVLVIDDGSTDDTASMVARDYPVARLISMPGGRGLVAMRNLGILAASHEIVITFDDDVVLPFSHTVEQTIKDFIDPRVAAVAIPYLDVGANGATWRHKSPGNDDIWVTGTFTGCANAIRRSCFLRVGGYRAEWMYSNEEPDLCLRLLEAGLVVRIGTADPVHHIASVKRSFSLMDRLGRRNEILFDWCNAPARDIIWHLPTMNLKGLLLGLRLRRPVEMIHGITAGYAAIVRRRIARTAVAHSVFTEYLTLRRRPSRLGDVVSRIQARDSTYVEQMRRLRDLDVDRDWSTTLSSFPGDVVERRTALGSQ